MYLLITRAIMHEHFFPLISLFLFAIFSVYIIEKADKGKLLKTISLFIVGTFLLISVIFRLIHVKSSEGKIVSKEECFIETVIRRRE